MANAGRGSGGGGQKLSGFSTAVGAWDSSGTWRRINAEQTPERIRVWLQDKIVARGKRVGLWLPVQAGDVGTITCTCEKVSTDASQRRCDSCYGMKTVPGYRKFLHETIFFASAEYADLTLTNVAINTKWKPFPLEIIAGSTSGTIETPDKTFANPDGVDYEIGVNAFMRAAGATVGLEFSTDSGMSWNSVTLSGGAGLLLGIIPGMSMTGSGVVRLRVTLTRLSASDATTTFEIARIRRTMPEVANRKLLRVRPDMLPGEILIERTWVREQAELAAGQGRLIGHLADGSWTMPLDFFDVTIARDTPPAKVSDEGSGPHPFYSYAESVETATRYAITEIDYDTQLGLFSYQAWVDQRAQTNDPYALVF